MENKDLPANCEDNNNNESANLNLWTGDLSAKGHPARILVFGGLTLASIAAGGLSRDTSTKYLFYGVGGAFFICTLLEGFS